MLNFLFSVWLDIPYLNYFSDHRQNCNVKQKLFSCGCLSLRTEHCVENLKKKKKKKKKKKSPTDFQPVMPRRTSHVTRHTKGSWRARLKVMSFSHWALHKSMRTVSSPTTHYTGTHRMTRSV